MSSNKYSKPSFGSTPRTPRRREESAERPEQGARRGGRQDREKTPRASAADALLEIDRDILRLIARRTRMLHEQPQGRESTRMERELRAGWEAAAAKISRDPRLVRQLFALLQEVECLPRAREGGAERQEAFTLSPARRPVDYTLAVPIDCRRTRIFGAMAATTGSQMELHSVLVNDPLVGLVKGFNQLSPSLRWEEDGRLLCLPERGHMPSNDKAVLDRAVHVGEDMLNFLLLLFTMAVRPCRLKIMGESALKLSDFSSLRHFLPSIGARFTSIVPGQDGLPARLEASGILPDTVHVPADLEADAVLALCLSLACAPRGQAVTVHLAEHPMAAAVLDEVMDILSLVGAAPHRDGASLRFEASAKPLLRMPDSEHVPMDVKMAASLLCFPVVAGGSARLNGMWPSGRAGEVVWKLFEAAGLELHREEQAISARLPEGTSAGGREKLDDVCSELDKDLLPLITALAAQAAIHNGQAQLPACALHSDMTVADDFFEHLGIQRTDRTLRAGSGESAPWTSPSHTWAVALALVAFARPGLRLLNPGIVTEYMPGFWQWYNSLPSPTMVRPPIASVPEAEVRPTRRRIIAGYMPEDQMPEPLPMDD